MSVITIPRVLREKLGEEATEALVEVINKTEPDSAKIKAELSKEMATKEDIFRLELKIEAVKSEIDKSKVDSIKWMLAFWASQIGIVIAAMAVLLKFFIK